MDQPTVEYRALERRIRELEQRHMHLLQVLDLLPHYLYVIDGEGRTRLVNRATASAFGREPKSVLGETVPELTADRAQGAALLEQARQTMAAGEPKITSGVWFRHADGSDQLLQLHEVPFVDELTGEAVLLGIATNRTAEAHLEHAQVDRARLEKELDIARRIQQSLLPDDPPSVPGFSVAGWSRPADRAGGDFYDWFQGPSGTSYAVIGDAAGHGVGPALIAATTRAYLRATFEKDAPLHELLGHLNDMLGGELREGLFVTLAVAAIPADPRAPVRVISAGHGPSYYRASTEGRTRVIESHGPPLGVLSGYRFESAEDLPLEEGGVIALISDGFFERQNERGAQVGVEPLVGAIAAHTGDPSALIAAFRRAVDGFAGAARQSDDMTALVVERTPRSAPPSS